MYAASGSQVRRAQLAEGGSPRLAPSLFADLSAATRNSSGPHSPTDDAARIASRSLVDSVSANGVVRDGSVDSKKEGIVPKTAAERRAAAAKGLLRRTGRAVKTEAQIEKEKAEQAKRLAEKKRQLMAKLQQKKGPVEVD